MDAEELEHLIRPYTKRIGGLIQALRAVMATHKWISSDMLPTIASVFNLSVAEVRGVISFYSDFKTEPQHESTIRICAAEACQARGSRELLTDLEKQTDYDLSAVQIDHVYCLGLCPIGPAAEVNGNIVAGATVERITNLLT